MRVSVVILPDARWSRARSKWVEAQERGFSAAWTYDHLSWRSLRDGPWLGSIPLFGAVAEATKTLRFGTLVTSPNFRHPALLAKDAMTLDDLSGGRFDLGIGAGGAGFDSVVLGGAPLEPAQRGARFEEFVSALDRLLREPAGSYSGKFFTVNDSRTYPGCIQQPRVPFTIAAAGPKAMRVAAQYGSTWVTFGPMREPASPQDWFVAVDQQSSRLDAECERIGRDPASIKRMLLVGLEMEWPQSSIAAWDDFCGQASRLGFTDVGIHWPRPEDASLRGPPVSVFDEISSRLS